MNNDLWEPILGEEDKRIPGGEEGNDPGPQRHTKLLFGRISCGVSLLLAIGAVFSALLGGGANISAGALGVVFAVLGYFLGASRLATATVFLCAAAILFGLAASQGLIPGIAPSDRSLPSISARFGPAVLACPGFVMRGGCSAEMLKCFQSAVESPALDRYTGCRMERVRLTPPGEKRARGGRARLYVRWMPHLGAQAVALYELLRILPDLGNDAPEIEELAELLRSTPEGVEASLEALIEARFVVSRDGWLEVADHPPSAEASEWTPEDELPDRDVEVIRAEPAGVSADDYFRFMGTLPAPHILEFLNGYCGRDGLTPDAVREALKIASERDARRVGYVRSILERWVERGVKTIEDVERFEQDRKLRLVEQSGAVRGGALKIREGVSGGPDRQSAARRREGYEWLFGETE